MLGDLEMHAEDMQKNLYEAIDQMKDNLIDKNRGRLKTNKRTNH